MTLDEAIDYNKNLRMYMRLSDKNQPYKFLEENYIALDMAIKALEQRGCVWEIAYERGKVEVIDKIKAEIERKVHSGQWSEATMYGMLKAVAIIDKYKAESEDKE